MAVDYALLSLLLKALCLNLPPYPETRSVQNNIPPTCHQYPSCSGFVSLTVCKNEGGKPGAFIT